MSDPGEAPTCYRHPGRETYVSCVRCGRYACPDCLRSAAVGQQCVECVKESNAGVRPAKNVFGSTAAAPRAGRGSSRMLARGGPSVTFALIAVNVLLFLVEIAKPSLADSWEMLARASYVPFGPAHGVAAGEWYRLITSAFIPPPVNGPHGVGVTGFIDIAFNMYVLYLIGPALEQALGRIRFFSVYMLSALGGSVMYYYLAAVNAPAAGASGAVFGLFGAWFVVARRLRMDARGIVTLIVINLVLGFVIPRIGWQAHIGGLLTGALLTAAYAYAPRKGQLPVQVAATVGVLALAIVAVILRTHQLGG